VICPGRLVGTLRHSFLQLPFILEFPAVRALFSVQDLGLVFLLHSAFTRPEWALLVWKFAWNWNHETAAVFASLLLVIPHCLVQSSFPPHYFIIISCMFLHATNSDVFTFQKGYTAVSPQRMVPYLVSYWKKKGRGRSYRIKSCFLIMSLYTNALPRSWIKLKEGVFLL
jgi:hypothetical protein